MALLQELKTRFPLHTLDDVAGIFPGGTKKKVEELARQYGCFRDFHGTLLFTDDDVRSLLGCIRGGGAILQGKPVGDTPGHVVFIGSRTLPTADLFVGWAVIGGIDSLVKNVASFSSDPAELLDYAPATYAEYEGYLTEIAAAKVRGRWHAREPGVQKLLTRLFDSVDVKDDELTLAESE